uniref:phosphoenolpyruvate--glycerone phosphotransferase n=1 Tax=Streptomyces rochei TaxID=1928 RepID=A0A0U3TKS4_STRRO|nr:dihydroxyacetone kinase [Streptomyces rochei]
MERPAPGRHAHDGVPQRPAGGPAGLLNDSPRVTCSTSDLLPRPTKRRPPAQPVSGSGRAHAVLARDLRCRKADTATAGIPTEPRPTGLTGVTEVSIESASVPPEPAPSRHGTPRPRTAPTHSEQQRSRSLTGLPGSQEVPVKMLINVPETVVADALRGMAAAHPELTVDVENRVIVRSDAPVAGKVALVSGGGSGHEPLHGGFVGPGMLSAACPGEVFTSPVPDQMVRAAAAVDSGAGVLFVVKNYTGDVLNFDMAAELAEDEGIQVAKVLVDDDVAVTDSLYTAGRRGTGATLFVEKIAGAAADEGRPLEQVEAIARRVNEASRSFGVALSACTTPAKGSPTFDLPAGELELGIGIHGEPGRERRPMMTSGEIAEAAVDAVLTDLNPRNPVLVLVNGMGATPLLELYGFNAEVQRVLGERGTAVARTLVGNYVTSLDMAGASVTLCEIDEELLGLWDAPVRTPGLRWGM